MQADHIQRREPSPAREDEIIEAAVLTQLIALHPAQLTILELAFRMKGDCEDFAAKDAVERAVRELTRDGLSIATAGVSGRLARRFASTPCSAESSDRGESWTSPPASATT